MTKAKSPSDVRHSHTGYVLLGASTIVLSFVGFVGWAATAPISSAAIAAGRVEVESATKPVQHLEGGLLNEILVKEGARVKRGDVLFRLQPVRAKSTLQSLQVQLDTARAAKARLQCEQVNCPKIEFPKDLLARKGESEIAMILAGQRRQRLERSKVLLETISIAETQLGEALAQKAAAQARANSLKIERNSLTAQIKRIAPLVGRGNFPRNKFGELKRSQARLVGNLASARADVVRHTRSAAGKKLRMQNTRQRLSEEISRQMADTNLQIAKLTSETNVASDAVKRVAVRAAKDGVVQNIKVAMRGEVVAPGSLMAEIVPVSDRLVVGTKVAPKDIDSVAPGHFTQLRVKAFSASRTAPITGRVLNVSADTVRDEVTGGTFYKVRIEIDASNLKPEMKARLLPGMPVDVIIAKGERTVLQYLMDPLLNAFAKSMRET